MNIARVVRDASTIFSSHLQLQQNLLPVTGVLQRSIKTSVYQSQCGYTIFKKCCLSHWTFPPLDNTRHDIGDTVFRGESLGGEGGNQLECWNKHLIGCRVSGWEKGGERPCHHGDKATDGHTCLSCGYRFCRERVRSLGGSHICPALWGSMWWCTHLSAEVE